MKYRLEHDSGRTEIEAAHDAEAQTKARKYLSSNLLLPQRRRNYLYRHSFIPTAWNVLKCYWEWIQIPF